MLWEVLLNYLLVTNLLLKRVSNLHILKTRLRRDKPFPQVSSNEVACERFKLWPYLTSHMTGKF